MSAAPSPALQASSPGEASTYPSRLARSYVGWLERRAQADVLDIGPVCGETIDVLLPRVRTVSVCDLYVRLRRDRDAATFVAALPSYLDYRERSFDSIHLWDLPARLADEHVRALMERVLTLLRPDGAVVVTSAGEGADPAVYAFALQENLDIRLKPQPHLALPFIHRHNRDILAILTPLALVNSYVYRSGLREFQFRLPEARGTRWSGRME